MTHSWIFARCATMDAEEGPLSRLVRLTGCLDDGGL